MSPTWTEQYNIHRLTLAKFLVLEVAWATDGYTVKVGNRRLKQTFRAVQDGKQAALQGAYRLMADVHADLHPHLPRPSGPLDLEKLFSDIFQTPFPFAGARASATPATAHQQTSHSPRRS